MGYQLVMIRHGESVWNQKNLFTGWTDVDLSETGHKEAAQGGVLLKEAGFSLMFAILLICSVQSTPLTMFCRS